VVVVQVKGSHALLLFTHDGSSRVAHGASKRRRAPADRS